MAYRWLTDLTIAVHFAFLVYVLAGGVMGRRSRWLTGAHLCAVAWAVYVQATPGLVCPLTPLENYFAIQAGGAGYEGSFIEHYLVPIIYPEGLTPAIQVCLAAFVLAVNAAVYLWPSDRRWWNRHRLMGRSDDGTGGT